MKARFIFIVILSLVVLAGGAFAVVWTTCRVWVPEDSCAVLIRKMGQVLPPGQMVATEPGQRGIQEEVLGPGRHFLNPFVWDWELKKLTVISAGDPSTWEWVHSLDKRQRDELRAGRFQFRGRFPQIGVVTRKVGRKAPAGQVVVPRASGYEGILEEVLTPGTYKINPYIFQVDPCPAVVIPSGFVGVVTNLFGSAPKRTPGKTILTQKGEPVAASNDAATRPAEAEPMTTFVPPLAEPGERGTLRDVLQPGVYFINPRLQKVTLVEIGYNEYSQDRVSDAADYRISFPSDTGFNIRVAVTVVWGIEPQHAADVINEFGNVDGVLEKVIGPQLRSICRNIGSTYAARDFIQGEKRELFQRSLGKELQRVCRAKHISVQLALVREIEVLAPEGAGAGGSVTEDLKRTIQESYIAIEKQLTKQKQRDAATAKAQLEQERKRVDIARETIRADTRVQVANILAEGEKEAAQISAQAALEVAGVQQQVAELDGRRTEIMGKARADVERLKNEAEARGYKLLVEAFGSPAAYNLYTFAEHFQPESIRLIFAGEGTFWTDLKRFEEIGAAKVVQPGRKSSK